MKKKKYIAPSAEEITLCSGHIMLDLSNTVVGGNQALVSEDRGRGTWGNLWVKE
ncbi:MAG: hypothetical protein J6V20_04140 [Bacteroidaceae bacterium]|nr:hypothetical protein [Bacteroidaceae bacterium]